MAARKTVPTVAVCSRSDKANREDFPPPPYTFYFYFYFCIFFVIFLPCFVLTWAIFLIFFCIFFMFTNFGIPDIERRKRKRNLLIGQPQGSFFIRKYRHTVFICIDLKLLFLVACLLED